MNNIEKFNFDGMAEVRVTTIDGEPRFVLSDMAKLLGYRDAEVAKRVLQDKHYQSFRRSEGTPFWEGFDRRVQNVTLVTESGLYQLIMRSNMPDAAKFQDWVTAEVLPTIRKTGGAYVQPGSQAELDLSDPDTMLDTIERATSIARDERTKRKELEQLREDERYQREAYASFLEAPDDERRDIRTVARFVKNEGFDIKEQDFLAILRTWKWIEKTGTGALTPATDKGYMVNRPIVLANGKQKNQGMFTSKGIDRAVHRLSTLTED